MASDLDKLQKDQYQFAQCQAEQTRLGALSPVLRAWRKIKGLSK